MVEQAARRRTRNPGRSQANAAARAAREAKAAAARRAARRNRALAVGGSLVIVGLVVAIVVSLVHAARKHTPARPAAATTATVVAPAGATSDGAIAVGRADAPVTVTVYLDYMCPFCGRFERANSGELRRLVDDGTVRLAIHPLSFLDRASSGSRFSTRAANAAATVADGAPDRVLAFNEALFAHQPEEGTRGQTDEELRALAVGAGVPAAVADRFTAQTFQPWIAKYTEAAFAGSVDHTPTVLINGKAFTGDLYTAGPLTQAIAAAKAR